MQISRSYSAIGAPETTYAGKSEQKLRHDAASVSAVAAPSGRASRAEADSVSVPMMPDPSMESPSMQAALKAAEQVRASLLEQGITPTMSAIDAAKLMALLGD